MKSLTEAHQQDTQHAEESSAKRYTYLLVGALCIVILILSVRANPSFERRASHYISYQFNKLRYFSIQDIFKKNTARKTEAPGTYLAPTAYPSAGPIEDKYVAIIDSAFSTKNAPIFETKFFPNHEYGQALDSSTGQYYQYLVKENYDNSFEDILQWNNFLLFTKHELDYEKKQITVNVYAYDLAIHENKILFTHAISVESVDDFPDRIEFFSVIDNTLYFTINNEQNYGGIKASLYAVNLPPMAPARKVAEGRNLRLIKNNSHYSIEYQGGVDGGCLTGWFDLQAFYPPKQAKGPLLSFSSSDHSKPEFIDYYSDNEIIAAQHVESKIAFDEDDCENDYTNLYIQNMDNLDKQYLIQGSAMPEQVNEIHFDKALKKILLISKYFGTIAVYDVPSQSLKKFDLSIQGLMRAEFMDANNVCIVSSYGSLANDNQYVTLDINSGEKTPFSTPCEKDIKIKTDDYPNNLKSLQQQLNELKLPTGYTIEYSYR